MVSRLAVLMPMGCCLVLAGCAAPAWQESVYRGVQRSAQACQAAARPAAAPCPALPDYAEHERERRRAQAGGAARSSQVNDE